MPDVVIASPQNPHVKRLVALRRRRIRERTQRFIVDGKREVSLLIRSGFEVEEIYICAELLGEAPDELAFSNSLLESSYPIRRTTRAVFERISYRENPDGVLAVASQQTVSLTSVVADADGIFLCVDGIEKPGNLGAMARVCDALAVSGLVICDPIIDVYNPNVVRSSVGAITVVPFVVTTRKQAVTRFRELDIQIVVTSPQSRTDYTTPDLSNGVVIVIGSEKDGLDRFWFDAAHSSVSLPTLGATDSMNAATSATAMLFEAYRQRRETAKVIPGS